MTAELLPTAGTTTERRGPARVVSAQDAGGRATRSSPFFLHERVRTRRSACATIFIYSTARGRRGVHRCVPAALFASARRSTARSQSLAASTGRWPRSADRAAQVLPGGLSPPPRGPAHPSDRRPRSSALPCCPASSPPVPLRVEPGVLEVAFVLVGPEPGDLTVRLVLAQHVAGRGRALLQRSLASVDGYPPARTRDGIGWLYRRLRRSPPRPS